VHELDLVGGGAWGERVRLDGAAAVGRDAW